MTMERLFSLLDGAASSSEEAVYYLQSQNGNLSDNGDLSPLSRDVGKGPSFAEQVFGEDSLSALSFGLFTEYQFQF